MGNTSEIPSGIATEFSVSNAEFIEKTAIATIWKVSSDQGLAALKIYHKPTMGAEANGFVFIKALNGGSATKIFQTSERIALTEWLSGPSLGDMARNGNDAKACVELVDIANRIHQKTANLDLPLPPLNERFSALFDLKFSENCTKYSRENMMFGQRIAKELLASQVDIRPLHGDLHHDNIRLGERGYCAFDAKGIIGERAFELANAFRNPKGTDRLMREPDCIKMRLDIWSSAFAVDQKRLMQWAVAKCALSITWRSNRMIDSDAELDLLTLFIKTLHKV